VYLEGTFDAPTIQQRLLDLGYHEESASGRTYYAFREDLGQPDPQDDPTVRAASSLMNQVFLGDGVLVTSPSTGPMEKVLAALAGEASSLAGDPVISNLASALGDPLSAAFLTRQMALEPEGDIIPTPAVRHAKPEGWGSLHQWEAVGIGYGISEGQPWWAFSLFYPDPAAAEADAQELVRRIEGYTTVLPQLLDGQPIRRVCGTFQSIQAKQENGSVLTVRCAVWDEAMVGELWALVETWDVGFLVP
jgi:hypothetical protein